MKKLPTRLSYLQRLVPKAKGRIVVSYLGTSAKTWARIRPEGPNFMTNDFMGLNLSVALGIAVAQPDKSVIVMEGDGGLMMKMESLITVGAKAPPNLLVITFNNKFYVTGGGQPLPTDKIDLESFAQAALFPQTATVDSPDAFDAVLDRMLDSGKLGYINLLVARDPEKDLPGSKKDLLQGDGIPRPEEMRTDLVRWIRENCP